jgi:hypothetical protein
MPFLSQRMSAYREGLKVGEIKIVGPQNDIYIIGDIVAGSCQAGDELRAD